MSTKESCPRASPQKPKTDTKRVMDQNIERFSSARYKAT
jgi:hypothetical protein